MRRLLLHRMPALNNIARLPWIKGNIRKLEKGGSLWEPSRLFDNGEEGAWYDPSDLSTMFQDSAGTTPVTADGQPVGLILDKSQGLALGPELIVNGDFASGAGWDLSGGSIVAQQCVFNAAPSGAYAYQYSSNTPMVFRGRFDASNYTQGGFRLFAGGSGVSRSSNGSFSEVLSGNMSVAGININSPPCSVTVDNVSLRQILGNHASQATAAARPLYKVTGLCKWNDFDAVDDVLNTTFQSSLGSNCTVARGNVGAAPTILTGQTIGTSYANSVDNAGLIIVNRALTGQETIDLTAWLTAKGATS